MITEETIARMKQNLEVKNEFFVLDVIKHLEAQIEKMKNCQNCKHKNDSNTDYYCEDCKRFAYETDTDKWEFADV